jgi:nucleotide-binding universal stress UspA family protein
MKILVGYDGSNASKAAIELARTHARAFGARVLLVRSMQGGPEVPRLEFEVAEQDLGGTQAAAFMDYGIAAEHHLLVRGLTPGEDLVRFAAEHGVDEIIIGVRRRSKVGKALFGSTTQYVVLNARCPVVTVK